MGKSASATAAREPNHAAPTITAIPTAHVPSDDQATTLPKIGGTNLIMRNDVSLRVKNQTVAAKSAEPHERRHALHGQDKRRRRIAPGPLFADGRVPEPAEKPDAPERRRTGKPASRQAQLRPGHVKGSTQNQNPNTDTMNEAQITVSYMLVTGGRPAIRTRRAKPHAE